MKKIPCPSCRELNFDTDIVCWKCGKPLTSAAQSVSPLQMQVASTHQRDVSVPGRCATPDRRTTLFAAIIGAIVGAVASFLIHIPFIRFVDAASLPGVLTVPYLVSVMLAGAVAGVIAVSARQGWIIGALAYLAGGYLFGVYVHASGSALLMPPETTSGWGRMHTVWVGSGIVTAVSVIAALAIVRLIGMRGFFPGLLPLPFIGILLGWKMRRLAAYMYTTDANGNPVIARVVAGLAFVIALDVFFLTGGWEIIRRDQLRVVQESPVTMVARYVWSASQPSPDYNTLRLFLTSDLAKRAEGDPAVRDAMRIPLASLDRSARAEAQGVFIDAGHAVQETYSADRRSAEVALPVDPASGAVAVTNAAVSEGAQLVLFRVRLENGRWRIADLPVMQPLATSTVSQ